MQTQDNDFNIIEMWLRKDPTRWLAGAMSGLFAGAIALAVAGLLATMSGREFLFPVKVGALPVMSMLSGSVTLPFVNVTGAGEAPMIRAATETGFHLNAILAGLFFWEFIAMFFGAIYAHFAITNALGGLLSFGLVWGTFAWIFIGNLFLPAWRAYTAAQIAKGATFPIMITYGLCLASVAFFDRVIRGSRGAV